MPAAVAMIKLIWEQECAKEMTSASATGSQMVESSDGDGRNVLDNLIPQPEQSGRLFTRGDIQARAADTEEEEREERKRKTFIRAVEIFCDKYALAYCLSDDNQFCILNYVLGKEKGKTFFFFSTCIDSKRISSTSSLSSSCY